MKTFLTEKGTQLPILDLRGKDYLQVAHRVQWFREVHPEWSITTTPIEITPTSAYFRAVIMNDKGVAISTGHKYEDKQGFADFREKAETGAIGRALALVGFGTQFCADELEEKDRLADSPLPPKNASARPRSSANVYGADSVPAIGTSGPGSDLINEKQLGLLEFTRKKVGMPDATYRSHLQALAGVSDPSKIRWEKFNNLLGEVQRWKKT